MTDEQHESLDQENTQPADATPSSESPATDEIDVVSALAAISSLNNMADDADEAAEDEADESAPDVADADDSAFDTVSESDAEIAVADADDDYTDYADVEAVQSDFPHPPESVLHRGQMASIVPAALLIGAGAVLTVMLTTSADASLNMPLVAVLSVSGLGLAMITYWLSSARWTIGSFFVGMLLLLTGAMTAYLLLPNSLSIVQGWPLLFTAMGTAFVITDIVSPVQSRLWLLGLVLAISGFAGLVITVNLLDDSIIQVLSRLWPLALVITIVLLVVPIFRRNGR